MTTPNEYFEAAKKISIAAKDEGMYRAAINRLYYAAYHKCVEYHAGLAHMGILAGNGVHEQLIHRLRNPSAKLTARERAESEAIGKSLREICQRRAIADYEPLTGVSETAMMLSQVKASEIFANT